MRSWLLGIAAAGLLAVGVIGWPSRSSEAADVKDPMIVHNVYFSLKDASPQAKEKLVAACKKYLTKHPGEVYFAAGTLAEDFRRDVNDRDFDVSLHIVFENKKAHDAYQEAPRHQQFIDENKDNWRKVRVFDSVVRP
ncbi:MAG: Dabb family protein [Gemmataceae bacterium]|nr:Dabb family protein [Gemmataceae bacterium]MDW8266388.1 Dabb family protein [Gemmataceae bacterium]